MYNHANDRVNMSQAYKLIQIYISYDKYLTVVFMTHKVIWCDYIIYVETLDSLLSGFFRTLAERM